MGSFVWTRSDLPDPFAVPLPAAAAWARSAGVRKVHGAVEVRAPHALVAEALLVNPGAALGAWLATRRR